MNINDAPAEHALSPQVNYKQTPDIDPILFWNKLRLIINDQSGYIDKEQFESALHISMNSRRDINGPKTIYSFSWKTIDVDLFNGPDFLPQPSNKYTPSSELYITFSHPYENVIPSCISKTTLAADLNYDGWRQWPEMKSGQPNASFTKSRGGVSAYFFKVNNSTRFCVKTLIVRGQM